MCVKISECMIKWAKSIQSTKCAKIWESMKKCAKCWESMI